jgi:hypothetical protein
MEYRLEMIHFTEGEDHALYLVNCLNEFANQGWRVVSVDLSPHPSFVAAPLPVLLEREKQQRT